MITCNGCGDECRVVKIDNGVGPYEYWGFRGNHSDIHYVSNCCETEYTDPDEEPENERIAKMLEDEPPF